MLSAINIVCINGPNQSTSFARVFGRSIVFSDTGREKFAIAENDMLSVSGSVNAIKIMDRTWIKGEYFFQMATHQFHSNILKMMVP